MSFHRWGFVYLGLGNENPAVDRAVIEKGGLTTTIVAVPDEESGVKAAEELAADGAQTLEICASFSADTFARMIVACGGIPVGQTSYGMESVGGLAQLSTELFHRWAYIYLGLGDEDPAVDRAVIEKGGLTTTIVAVPDEQSAVAAARELAGDGAQAIEFCGGFSDAVRRDALKATNDTVPIGQVKFGMASVHGLAELFPR